MPKVARRDFIRTVGLAGAGVFAGSGFACHAAFFSDPRAPLTTGRLDYGPLLPTKSSNTGETLLELPKGFEYTVFGKAGVKMWDGHATPTAHDGMAAFQIGNELRLVRNHEVKDHGTAIGPNAYDELATGGTTTLVIDADTRKLLKDFVSLSGTVTNCAGGQTPWGSWISCEETVVGLEAGFRQNHGYCFEVDAAANEPVKPVPLKAMGRFKHEAVAVDPETAIIYLTEDNDIPDPVAGFYRFLPAQRPTRPGSLEAGGKLQMLAVKGKPRFDTRRRQKVGVPLAATWVDISNPDPPEAEMDSLAVYKQGIGTHAATFARLEGCLYGKGRIYFDSTSGGDRMLGQVWEYVPTGEDDGTLTLLFEASDPRMLSKPDNLCLNSAGNVVICEDNGVRIHLRVMNQRGELGTLARNIVKGYEIGEFAGVTFSPDFKTLFVNIQVPGLTFAIWGPW